MPRPRQGVTAQADEINAQLWKSAQAQRPGGDRDFVNPRRIDLEGESPMKCVTTYKTRENASEARKHLRDKGIDSKILVETLDGRYSALGSFEGLALCVNDENLKAATDILVKKAS
jgi:hypothetical protein